MKIKLLLIRNGLVMMFFLLSVLNANAQKEKDGKFSISDFQVLKDHNRIIIKWVTDKKSSTNYFEVERSSDGKNFKTVAYVLGADPTQNDCKYFNCFEKIDAKLKESFYRIKHVDINGIIQFSHVKMLALK